MSNCKPVNSPMSPSTKLSAFDSTSMEDLTLYCSAIGSLQYLLVTQLDIAFSVNRVCQFMHAPCLTHWQAIKCILHYFKHTIEHGLLISPSSTPALAAFSDVNWASYSDDHKSTGGYCVLYGKNLISWSSKKQTTIARSSMEAEYKALAHATCELLWLHALLSKFGIFLPKPPLLDCDNLDATYLSVNPVMHSRMKHVDIDYHFLQDEIQAKSLQISFLSSKDQLANILTKPLSTSRFYTLRLSLTVLPNQLGSQREASSITSAAAP